MSIRYGRTDCNHDWVYRKFGYEEQCAPIVCTICGAFGCACDDLGLRLSDGSFNEEKWDDMRRREVAGNANTSGRWNNPYVLKTAVDSQIEDILRCQLQQ